MARAIVMDEEAWVYLASLGGMQRGIPGVFRVFDDADPVAARKWAEAEVAHDNPLTVFQGINEVALPPSRPVWRSLVSGNGHAQCADAVG